MPKLKTKQKGSSSFVFAGDPEKVNVEGEAQNMKDTIGFDPYKLADALVTIGEKMYGVPLYDYQRDPAIRIIYSMLVNDGGEITMLFARQSGKSEIFTFCIIIIGVFFPVLAKFLPELDHFKTGVKMGLIAPQLDQVETVYSRCMERLWSDEVIEFMSDKDIDDKPLSTVHFKLRSGSFLKAQSGAKQSKIESKTYHIVFIDECQDMDTEKVHKCLSYDSICLLPNGTKVSLEEVYNKELKIAGHEGIIEPLGYHDTGLQKTTKITLTNGFFLSATDDHKHKVIRRGYKNGNPFFCKTSDLLLSDRLCVANSLPYFGEIGTYEEGLLVGYMLGDGYSGNSGALFCGFRPTIERMKTLVANYDCVVSERKENTENGLIECAIVGSAKRATGYRRNNKGANEFIELLRKYEVYGLKADKKKLPEKAYSRDFIRGYIEGLIETDGSVFVSDGKPHINFSNTSKFLTSSIQEYLHRFGIHGAIIKKPNNGNFSEISKDLHSFTVKDARSILTFGKEFELYEKAARLKEVVKLAKTKTDRNTSYRYPSAERYYKVTSLADDGVKQTYCITSDRPDHLWTVNGIVTHNSIMPMLASTYGTLVRSGTANRNKGDLFNKIAQNKKSDKKLRGAKKNKYEKNHFEYDYLRVIADKKKAYKKDGKRFHTLYAKSVTRDKKTMGENSEDFRLSYKLEWMIEFGMFITEERLEGKVLKKAMKFPKIESDSFVVAGLDVAKARASTVLTLGVLDAPAMDMGDRPRKTVAGWTELAGTNYEIQLEIITDLLVKNNVKILAIDATGVGAALSDPLLYYLGEYIQIVPCIFSTPFKSDMWKALDEDIDNNRFIVPSHKHLVETKEYKEFCLEAVFLTKVWKGSYMICSKTPGYKDDYMDSAGLMNVAGNTLYEVKAPMEVTSNILLNNGVVNRTKASWL